MSEETKARISYLWFAGRDGWQVTSFDPREDAAIGIKEDIGMYVSLAAYEQAQAEIENLRREMIQVKHLHNVKCEEIEKLKDRMARARKLILDDLKASPDCECGADNGSNYTDVICYRHAALVELK